MNKPETPELSVRPVKVKDVRVGEQLPYSVYDRQDNLLLRKGFVISSERQRDRLLEHGLTRHSDDSSTELDGEITLASDSFTVSETIEVLLARLEHAYRILRAEDAMKRFPFEIQRLALDIQFLCQSNPDALLGAMQISHDLPYGLIHPLHCAVLCELMAKRQGMPQMERLALVAGAVTHDIGITQLQERLHEQKEPLTEQQWQRIRRHPLESHTLIEEAGVDDPTWLNVVHHHHERLDGSGYPMGLKGDAIPLASRILAIADIYTAMIRPRLYRDAFVARDVLRSIFQDRGKTVDPQLVQIFIREIGIFPPGAFVRLKNNETAVIQQRGEDPSAPVVFSVQASDGSLMNPPKLRDTTIGPFAILSMLPHRNHPLLYNHLNALWPPLPAIATH